MPADVSPSALPDSRPLHRLIRRTRRLLRLTWITTGLGLGLACCSASSRRRRHR